jgi:CrcB protein
MGEPVAEKLSTRPAGLPGALAQYVLVILAVGFGGAIGAIGRWKLAESISRHWRSDYPWATFLINLSGCFVLGWYLGFVARRGSGGPLTRLAITTGVLGAYTTFSAFAYESVRLIQHGRIAVGAVYVVASLVLGILSTAAGLRLSRGA